MLSTSCNPGAPHVDIVMGTYNGARYLVEQVRSIQSQTFGDWRLLLRDDGSVDGTVRLLRTLADTDKRVQLVEDGMGNLGFNDNFHHLLSLSTANYTMFADQDDVWLPAKIEKTLAAMRQQEQGHPRAPVLVHCDAFVADSDLKPLRNFFVARRAVHGGLESLLFANAVQGATMMVNQRLRELLLRARPVGPYDYQAGLIAEATGYRVFVKEPLMHYRQHGSNALGAGTQHPAEVLETPSGRRYVSPSFEIGLAFEPALRQMLEPVRDQWHPSVEKTLDRHARFVHYSPSLFSVFWALAARYQYFRRRDRIDALLFSIGVLRSRSTRTLHSY